MNYRKLIDWIALPVRWGTQTGVHVERSKERLFGDAAGPGIEEYSAIASDLTAAGYRLKRFTEQEPDLEAAFMAFTKGSGDKI